MTGYITGVFAISALLGLCSLLSYGKDDERVRKFAFSILLLYVTVLPLSGISLGDIDFGNLKNPGTNVGEYENVAREAFISGIREHIAREYSLDEDNIRVLVEDFDFSVMRAGRIRIILSGSAVFADYKGIEKYVNNLDMGECRVEIEIG